MSAGFVLDYPYLFVLQFIVEALAPACVAYGLIWLGMRPKNRSAIQSPFFFHTRGVALALAGGAIFRYLAMATFAGRGAYEPAPETGAAAFYLFVVPAIFAAGYLRYVFGPKAGKHMEAVSDRKAPQFAETTPDSLLKSSTSHSFCAGSSALPSRISKWNLTFIDGAIVIGIAVAGVLLAYLDHKQRSTAPTIQTESVKRSQLDEFLSDAPKSQPTGTPTQQNAEKANPFDPGTARPVDETNKRPFTYEEAIAPKTQSAVEQEHYRRIYAAHPDADAVHGSRAFQAWLAKYPTYQRIMAKGTTQEIIEMFTAYKNQR